MIPNVSSLLSGAVSVGIIAGVVTGIFHLFLAGLRWAGEAKQQSGEWFYDQLNRRRNPALVGGRREDGAVMDPDTNQVREFIERLVETLVSGGLDDVTVNRLYSHPDYKPLPEEESPSAAHAALKQLIQRVVEEAMTLPRLQQLTKKMANSTTVHAQHLEDISSKTYEDILARAILNKVIENYQQYASTSGSPVDGNSNILHSLAHKECNSKYISQLSLGSNGTSGVNPELAYDDLDIRTRDTASWIESAQQQPIAVMIEECVEETVYNSSGDEEDGRGKPSGSELDYYLSGLNFVKCHRVPFPEFGMDLVDGSAVENDGSDADEAAEGHGSPQPTDLINPVDSWEENWLFQRKRLKAGGSAPQQMPVPMLVPNPSEDYRALIGDRDAEEISDLSDCSDGALEDVILADLMVAEDKNNSSFHPGVSLAPRAVDDPTWPSKDEKSLNIAQDLYPVKTIAAPAVDSSVKQNGFAELLPAEDEEHALTEATNVQLCKSPPVDCLPEFEQQDSEYTEDYASVTQRQLNSLTLLHEVEPDSKPIPKPRQLGTPTQPKSRSITPENGSEPSMTTDSLEQVDELFQPPRPGTIAEREHKKWESAVPLPNNPYSPENISKRLSQRQYLSRNSSNESDDLPELKLEPPSSKITVPLKVVCTNNDLDFGRYGRDYYINGAKASSQKKSQPTEKQGSNVQKNSSPAQSQDKICDHLQVEIRSWTDSELSCGVTEFQSCVRVENEVARWQTEINKTEERWRKELEVTGREEPGIATPESCESISPAFAESGSVSRLITNLNNKHIEKRQQVPVKEHSDIPDSEKNQINNKPEKSIVMNNCKIFEDIQQSNKDSDKILSRSPNFEKRQLNNKGKVYSALNKARSSEDLLTVHTKDNRSIPNGNTGLAFAKPCLVVEGVKTPIKDRDMDCGKRWELEMSHSECSTVSSDCELSVLPSVKELAKHFSAGTESDSSTSTPQRKSPSRRPKGGELNGGKTVVIVNKKEQETVPSPSRPVRQVHSLTARSISREFREGLRRNLPVTLDRNLHSIEKNDSGRETDNRSESYDTTPGYTSDESGTASPTPTAGKLRNNIAFWEQMQHTKKISE